ncbi:hypothetical protein SAMN05880574_1393 [Chryseobacterium sp. RU37D]|uniref:transposase n=1 Tax=Chryseobacterium sp. RU37D TaxID=1907397 RepID=UPI0009542763|nr:transposase [Chryseobacterium sp. RU37D]SIQ95486.1 hypothetical protein SAMN05880574_1393 [Chryseobacterium sp. RU37D]
MKSVKVVVIGSLIEERVKEIEIGMDRICNFFKCSVSDIESVYKSKSIDSDMLLKWSKLLEYDFFRIYTQHLVLYSPMANTLVRKQTNKVSKLPRFRKNIYTKDLIAFILKMEKTGKMTKKQIIEEYRIPKTTLYKWISKYDQIV